MAPYSPLPQLLDPLFKIFPHPVNSPPTGLRKLLQLLGKPFQLCVLDLAVFRQALGQRVTSSLQTTAQFLAELLSSTTDATVPNKTAI